MKDGVLQEHIEFERYNRIKASGGDSLDRLIKNGINIDDVDHWVSVSPNFNLERGGKDTFNTHDKVPKVKFSFYSHHLCHAAHAFYSSNFEDSIVLTLDMAGLDYDGSEWSTCVYHGKDTKIKKLFGVGSNQMSLGNLWSKCTRFIFKLSAGYPRGSQAGSVMALAAFGDPEKYYSDFKKMITDDFRHIVIPPPGMVRGKHVPPEEDVIHPYLNKYRKIAESSEQEKFNLAASLQKVTEEIVYQVIDSTLAHCKENNISFENSVMTGKLVKKYEGVIKKFYVPPVPYDGGLNIGACQYHWHHVLGKERDYQMFVSPYLGETYSEKKIIDAIESRKDKINFKTASIESIVELLKQDKIISIFQGRSESGRRALGNRSILASPINPKMKDFINDKVKHRQWYRPFAPSVLHEEALEWFENYFLSPYMGFVFKIKDEKLGLAPAIEHKDGTARIQSVTNSINPKYHELISLFYKETGIPMLLNTSFNDREPIVETPDDALNCYLKTNIDYLYFADCNVLVERA